MKIIAIEGIDGSGKSMQFHLLHDALVNSGKKVETMDFPVYDSFFGDVIGKLLRGSGTANAANVDPMSMALWFAMDRWAKFKEGVSECDYLLLNRYVMSNAAYQSSRCKDEKAADEMIDWVLDLEHNVLGLPRPDVYVFLNVAKKQADVNVRSKGHRDYVGGDKKDVYEDSDAIQDGARSGYMRCAEKTGNVIFIECMKDDKMLTPAEIHGMITEELRKNNII